MKLLNFLKKRHQNKIKEKERQDFFQYFKKESPTIWESPFSKLNEVVSEATDKKNIQSVAEKIKKHKHWIAFNQPANNKKEDSKTIIEKLREISQEK